VARRRAQWRSRQGKIDQKRLVFIDETGAKANMTRARGRCAKGQRLVCKTPRGKWRSMTCIAALRADGVTAPCVLDGAVNGESFLAYVRQLLVPTLRRGDVVIMDNLRVHKVRGVRQAIRAAGAKLLFLPKYSPDLNPIEMVFAKLKALLRGAAESTLEATWRKIGVLVGAFTPAECAGYIRHAGYCGST
jgi:transposase